MKKLSETAAKIELMARIFAETGVKSLFKGILHLLCKYQDKARLVRMRGEFVFTAKAVRAMGNGSRRKGAKKMYKLMKMLEGKAA